MNTIALAGNARTETGTSRVSRMRLAGNIPCVLYSKQGPVHFTVENNTVRKLIYTPETYLVELTVDGKSYKSVIRETQFHPVHDQLLHVDFVEVTEDQPIEVLLPLKLTGTSPGMLAGGKLVQKQRRLRVRGLFQNLPAHLSTDVSSLGLGKSLKVRDISFPNLEVRMAADVPLASIEIPRALRQDRGPQGGK